MMHKANIMRLDRPLIRRFRATFSHGEEKGSRLPDHGSMAFPSVGEGARRADEGGFQSASE